MARYDPQLLTREEYLGSDVQYGRQVYGKYGSPLDSGLEDDISVDVPGEDNNGDNQGGVNVLEMTDITSGQPVYGVTYGLPAGYKEGTYESYLESAGKKDRLSGMFSAKDFEFTVPKVASGIVSKALGFPMGLLAPALVGHGDTVKNAFGNDSFRPAGPLGMVADMVHAQQYEDMSSIAKNVAIGSKAGGFAMQIGNGGITRKYGGTTYTGNMMDLTFEQVKARDAISKGFVPNGFDMAKETGKTFEQAGWLPTSYSSDPSGLNRVAATGFYTQSGNFINQYGEGSMYGTKTDAQNLANAYGVSYNTAIAALGLARTGEMDLSDALQKGMLEEAGQDESALESGVTSSGEKTADFTGLASTKPGADYTNYTVYDDDDESTVADDNNDSNDDDDYGGGDTSSVGSGEDFGYGDARGGMITHGRPQNRNAYAMGTPPSGVQAVQSGFVDAPPSRVPEDQKVADNRPAKAKEGTYVLNAAAVEFAGEQDIRKMIMDAQKEAVRRGLSTEDFERHSNLIDIAVSSGEVTIAPHLVKIIGEDRLEKINKRGLRKTEERIAENGQEPVPARRGGFI